jgi:hypothetical protein
MRLQRDEVAALFRQQAHVLDIEVVQELPNYLYEVMIDETAYIVCALPRSSDYYHCRLNLTASHVTALVVATHDTRVSMPVLALDEGYFYAPSEAPRWYQPEMPRTRKQAMVIIGGLLSGVEEAFQQVNAMKPSTRYRYFAHMRSFLSFRQGRQLIV